jgi:uncharacterized protein (TIGR02284 family)
MENQKQVIDQVNKIIQTNLDRTAGYEKAKEQAKDPQLRTLFAECSDQSRQYVTELKPLVEQFGGQSATETSNAGDMYRVWMDIKTALASNNAKAVLQNCEKGEDVALNAYNEVTNQQEGMALSDHRVHQILNEQHAGIESMHQRIRTLRDQQD